MSLCLGEKSSYKLSMQDAGISRETEIKRELMSVFYKNQFLMFQAGLILRTEWTGTFDSMPGYDEFSLENNNGDGWRIACRLSGDFINDRNAELKYWIDLSHSREEFKITHKVS